MKKEDEEYLSIAFKKLDELKINYEFSYIDINNFNKKNINQLKIPFYISEWQDTHEFNKLTFDGLIDLDGKPKTDYFDLMNLLKQQNNIQILPQIKILKPSKLLYTNEDYQYNALVMTENSEWVFGESIEGISFEWSLIKCNENGELLAIKKLEQTPKLNLKIPEDWEYYKIRLRASNDTMSRSVYTTLNTPLFQFN